MADMKAVQFDRYGDVDVLTLRRVSRPKAGPGEVLVALKATGINPGEISIRSGKLHERWPAKFPSGQGSDLAGVVEEIGDGVTDFKHGDEVLGFTDERAAQAEFVAVPAGQLTAKPTAVSWEVAGALFVTGTTAYAAVQAVDLKPGDTVAVSAAAGGVGSIAVQLAKHAGATVLGIAGPANDPWLADHGVIPVNYGDGLCDRLKEAASKGQVDAFLDFFGDGYVELAVTELGISPQRVNSIIDFDAVEKFKTKSAGNLDAASSDILAYLAERVARGEVEVPIADIYPLDDVRDAYRALEKRHTQGKIVLRK